MSGAFKNINEIRKDFPILSRKIDKHDLVYLDSAATSQKPKQVIEAIKHYYEHYNANIHRGIHTLSEEATQAFEDVRQKVCTFIGAKEPKEIVFTRNTTEAINIVALSWGRKNIVEGDEILLSPMEHHSNLVPWQMLADACKAKLTFCQLDDQGFIDMDSFKNFCNAKTKLVAITQMSNVLGSTTPLKEICQLAHKYGALVLVDGAQGVPHLPTNVVDINCDFLAFSLHKMLGPTGVGILWARAELLEEMPPVYGGGDMISAVWRERSTYNQIPWKFEAGTPNIADVIASGVAIDYLQNLGMANVHAHEIALANYTVASLQEMPDITLYGPKKSNSRAGVVSFNMTGIHPHDLGQVLNEAGVAIRVGHHCCQPLMRDLQISGTARASFYIYTKQEEVDILVDALKKARKVLGHVACR